MHHVYIILHNVHYRINMVFVVYTKIQNVHKTYQDLTLHNFDEYHTNLLNISTFLSLSNKIHVYHTRKCGEDAHEKRAVHRTRKTLLPAVTSRRAGWRVGRVGKLFSAVGTISYTNN